MISRYWLAGLTLATVFFSLIFYLFPQIDLAVSAQFQSNGNFILEKGNRAAIATDIMHYGMRIVFFAYVALGAILLSIRKEPEWLSLKKYLFVILSVALAAGLMTNVLLKDNWGRARPNQTAEFGGTLHFTPAWVISDQCGKNCSFVGGDVSFAFCALAPAMLATRRKRLWISFAIAFGTVIALGRLAAGGHYFSDCVLAALLTCLLITAMYTVWIKRPGFN